MSTLDGLDIWATIASGSITRTITVNNDGIVKIYVGNNQYSTARDDSAYVTIYYTKTTD
jgi:phage tail sheath gpL-like